MGSSQALIEMAQGIEVNVLAYQEGESWVAQCVEFDIRARAESLPKLPRAFQRAFLANLSVNVELGRDALAGIGPAPAEFRRMFDEAEMTALRRVAPQAEPIKIRDLRVVERVAA